MRSELKLAVFAAYVLVGILLADLPAGAAGSGGRFGALQTKPGDLVLDKSGPAGPVTFNHPKHEAVINPNPAAPHRAPVVASCSGCHHTMSSVPKIGQFQSCSVCHRERGNERNPRSKSGDEIWLKAAYHNTCIGCHTASRKGPTTCSGCHRKAVA